MALESEEFLMTIIYVIEDGSFLRAIMMINIEQEKIMERNIDVSCTNLIEISITARSADYFNFAVKYKEPIKIQVKSAFEKDLVRGIEIDSCLVGCGSSLLLMKNSELIVYTYTLFCQKIRKNFLTIDISVFFFYCQAFPANFYHRIEIIVCSVAFSLG